MYEVLTGLCSLCPLTHTDNIVDVLMMDSIKAAACAAARGDVAGAALFFFVFARLGVRWVILVTF